MSHVFIVADSFDGKRKGGSEEPPALTFAHTPQKHAYIDRDRRYSLPYKINNLR